MRTKAGMAAARTRHSIRLALVCVALAMAGGAPAARAVYAEVSARAVAVVRAEAHDRDVAPLAAAPSSPAPPASAVDRPIAPVRAVAPLYLAHGSLLL